MDLGQSVQPKPSFVHFVQDLYKNLRDKKQTDVIVMDFAKAFDKVPPKKLIRKLREYREQRIESFLHQRQQRVVCHGWGSVLMGSSNKLCAYLTDL